MKLVLLLQIEFLTIGFLVVIVVLELVIAIDYLSLVSYQLLSVSLALEIYQCSVRLDICEGARSG